FKGDYVMSEALLYAELEKGNFKPNDYLLFANTLNADNKPSLAKEFYKEYSNLADINKQSFEDQVIKLFQENSGDYLSSRKNTSNEIVNPTLYDGKIFTSNQNKLMAYEMDCDGDFSTKREVLKNLTNLHFGSVTFLNEGNTAVASLIDRSNNNSSLYVFSKKKGNWKKPVPLFKDGANYAFPFYDESTKTLYFSSDRTGGLGGYDIYVSILNGKTFESPINLGSQINSNGNDINPTKTDEWLYFSSNGHISKGGYDIFRFKNLGDFNVILRNCFDFNTQEDDLSVIPTTKNKFYISRSTPVGYEFSQYIKPSYTKQISGTITNEDGETISNAYVFIDDNSAVGTYLKTNAEGFYIYKTDRTDDVIYATVMSEGYLSKRSEISEVSNVVLSKIAPIEIVKEVIVYKNVTSPSIYDTTVTVPLDVQSYSVKEPIIESNTGETESVSPERGLYYIIIGSTYDYAEAYDFWNKWLPTFYNIEILEYANNLYRIGFYAGTSEVQVMEAFQEAQKSKKDIWILRPKSQ
ncbi:MAG: carboxypeptidase regulatory-like domain-containing protein, partial [Bacteroidia bacterium]|nr:carboxypeptidase regulatory-like domain-containing protein [Bacteroidia bacterium]